MKKNLVILISVILSNELFSQPVDSSLQSQNELYLTRARHQHTAAIVMLSGGLLLTATGVIVSTTYNLVDVAFDETIFPSGPVMVLVGLGSTIGSIPLFFSSSKNKKKGFSFSLIREKTPVVRNRSFVNLSYPAVRLKIKLD